MISLRQPKADPPKAEKDLNEAASCAAALAVTMAMKLYKSIIPEGI